MPPLPLVVLVVMVLLWLLKLPPPRIIVGVSKVLNGKCT
jgi:hypothetical protein